MTKSRRLTTWLQAIRSRHKQGLQTQEEFDTAYARTEALINELSRYFDAIEADVSSSNVDVVKRGLDMFKVSFFLDLPSLTSYPGPRRDTQ